MGTFSDQPTRLRVRWGNVALALAAVVAIAVALSLPGESQRSAPLSAPLAELPATQLHEPTGATGPTERRSAKRGKTRRRRSDPRRMKPRHRVRHSAKATQPPAPVASPRVSPSPHPHTANPGSEFGL